MSQNIEKASQSEINDKSVLRESNFLPQEVEEGNREYKRQLCRLSPERLDKLISQLKWRITEGQGEAIYEIGVEDDGSIAEGLTDDDFEESLQTLQKMVKFLKAECTLLHEKVVSEKNEERKRVAEVLIRKFGEDDAYMDIRIPVLGNVDSGKSTLIGVLTSGELDNSRGKARANVFVHQHEMLTGRTSCLSYQILGYDHKGKIANYSDIGTVSWKEIVEKSSKVVTFIDLAGHQKYLKTTVFGMTGSVPDYSIVVVSANNGVVGTTKEHLGLCLHLRIPVFIVVTKIDMCPKKKLEETLRSIKKILRLPGVRKVPYVVKKKSDVMLCCKNILSQRVCPIFLVSNVTGENLDVLKLFLNLIPPHKDWKSLKSKPFEFMIDQTFYVTGIGCVVSGIVLQGVINIGDKGRLGPDSTGQFRVTQIKSIHHKRTPVKTACAGQQVCFALRKERRENIRKGMVIVEKNAQSCWEFESDCILLHHKTTITSRYTPVIHSLDVRQSAKIISMTPKVLKTGDKALIRFRFLYKPEFLKLQSRIIFREGRTKGIGVITKILPSTTTITTK